jgi:UDP-glucose 6-dehydrogenase
MDTFSLANKLQLIISVLTLLGMAFAVYKIFTKPDIDNEKEISLLKLACDLKHKNLDENIFIIRENHLRHLETDVKNIQFDIIEIKTILKEIKGGL